MKAKIKIIQHVPERKTFTGTIILRGNNAREESRMLHELERKLNKMSDDTLAIQASVEVCDEE